MGHQRDHQLLVSMFNLSHLWLLIWDPLLLSIEIFLLDPGTINDYSMLLYLLTILLVACYGFLSILNFSYYQIYSYKLEHELNISGSY